MKPFLIALALLAAAGGGYAVYLDSGPIKSGSPEAAFTVACEKELMGRLKAPATYQRVETVLQIEKISTEEALKEQLGNLDREFAKSESFKKAREAHEGLYRAAPPHRHTLWITYDAANSFGTPLRGTVECTVIDVSPERLTAEDLRFKSSIRIDGQTNAERLIEAATALGGQ